MAETCSPTVAIGYRQCNTSNLQARREEIFRKGAFLFLWVLMFVVPWENAVVIDGFGTIGRVVGIPAFGLALLAILECGTLRMLAVQQVIMVAFLLWGGLTYFWSSNLSATVTSIYTFVQLFMMVWLIWEFAQTHKEQLLLLRAYLLGSIIASGRTLLGFFSNTGLQDGRYSGLGFNPAGMAFVLVLAIPISLYLAVQERRKILMCVDAAAAVLGFCAIVLTASRESLLACVPTLLMFPFLFPKLRWGRNLLILLFMMLVGIGAWLFMPESSWSRLSMIGTEITSSTVNERTMIWQTGWQVFQQAPLRGVGAGAGEYAFTVQHRPAIASDLGGANSDSQLGRLVAQNTFFSVLVEQGIVGFALFSLLLITLGLSTWRLPRVERVFWLCILVTWGIGALGLAWEQRKPTWFILGLLITVAATDFAPDSRLFKTTARQKQQLYPQTATLASETPSSQGVLMKRRVLHVLANLGAGGAERMAVHIVLGLDRHRFEPAVVAYSSRYGSDLEQQLDQAGVKTWFLGKGPGFDARNYYRLHRVFNEFRPDIAHTHVHVMRYAFPSLMYFKPRLMVHTVNNIAECEIEPRARWLQRLAYRCGVIPVAVAREVAASLERVYGIGNCRVVWNCIPTELYGSPQTPRGTWRSRQGFHDDDILFLCVARFAAQKNHALLISAFAKGPAADPKTHLVLAGQGVLRARLQVQVNELGLTSRVHFLGLRRDIPDVLGAADIFTLSSDYEGNPLSVIEAMAAGLPVVSTAVGGVPELLQNGKEGFIVQPGRADELSQAMMALLRDRELRRAMGCAAAIRARQKFDVSAMVRAYEQLYDETPAHSHTWGHFHFGHKATAERERIGG